MGYATRARPRGHMYGKKALRLNVLGRFTVFPFRPVKLRLKCPIKGLLAITGTRRRRGGPTRSSQRSSTDLVKRDPRVSGDLAIGRVETAIFTRMAVACFQPDTAAPILAPTPSNSPVACATTCGSVGTSRGSGTVGASIQKTIN